ncbi:MAG: 3-deoxy-manno-octulosonate cytidylyltransferase [bacterium]
MKKRVRGGDDRAEDPKKKAVGIIPARYESSRFPGKSLAMIAGKPLIRHVYERSSAAKTLSGVLVATDDERIFRAVEDFGGTVVMTSPDHATGTDRLAEAAAGCDASLIVNIQGDEPLISPRMIDRAVREFRSIEGFRFGSAMTPIKNEDDLENPNVVKVVVDGKRRALYFTRRCIPYRRNQVSVPTFQHIGFYVYTKKFLAEFSRMPPTPLERAEGLEQLRALENGIPVHMIETDYTGVGVDVPEDIPRIERLLRES